jgi:hypothetical protein
VNERTQARFWAKVNKTETCWLWTGASNQAGYGSVTIDGQQYYAHRIAYQWLIGPIPSGLPLDHLCRQTACVNPSHLEPVTQRENVMRGLSPGLAAARQLGKTECPQGHPYDETNTYIRPSGARECRICAKRHVAEHYARKRSA